MAKCKGFSVNDNQMPTTKSTSFISNLYTIQKIPYLIQNIYLYVVEKYIHLCEKQNQQLSPIRLIFYINLLHQI